MSDDRPPTQPPTTRIGGGGSAHVAALVVVIVLVALVWVGWSGRTGGPGDPASPPPVAEASRSATGTPASTPPAADATPAPRGPDRSDGPPKWAELPVPPRIHLADDVYGFTANFDRRQYFAVLQETGSDRFTATVRLPFHRPRDGPSVDLHQLWTRAERPNYVELGSWPLPLETIDPDVRRSGNVLEVEVPARPRARDEALLVRRGYTLQVSVDSQLLFAILEVDVRLLPRGGGAGQPIR